MGVGGIGVGKTTQFLTLPGKKFAYLFDPHAADTLRGSDVDIEEFIPDITDIDLSVKTLKKGVADKSEFKKEPTTYVEWEEDFEKKYTSKFFDRYNWIMMDSHTTFSEIVMDRVQHLNQRLGKQPEQADWAAEMNTCKNVYRVMSTLSGLYVTVHTESYRDELTGKVSGKLMMTGRSRFRIPLRFAHIFGFKTDTDSKGAPIWVMRTVVDREFNTIRTSIHGLAPEEDVTLDVAKPLVGQGLGGIMERAYGPLPDQAIGEIPKRPYGSV